MVDVQGDEDVKKRAYSRVDRIPIQLRGVFLNEVEPVLGIFAH